jgi:hypothetical protein
VINGAVRNRSVAADDPVCDRDQATEFHREEHERSKEQSLHPVLHSFVFFVASWFIFFSPAE